MQNEIWKVIQTSRLYGTISEYSANIAQWMVKQSNGQTLIDSESIDPYEAIHI